MSKIITGDATPEHTAELCDTHDKIRYTTWPATGHTAAPLGFGAYRVHVNLETHRHALRNALLNGVNVVDTSANYTDGGSEQLIGSVLQECGKEGLPDREQIILISKAGYIQGSNLSRLQQMNPNGDAYPEIIHFQQGLSHCIHPDFIEDQITLSLERLQCETIDFFLLHNPEYYLFDAHKKGMGMEESRRVYYDRIDRAFLQLEQEAQRGRIQYYGISSNTFTLNPAHYAYTDYDRLRELARRIGKNNRFKMIQFPMNLMETGAADDLLQKGINDQVVTVSNRPLNAYFHNQLMRLVSLELLEEDPEAELKSRLKTLVEHEKKYLETVAPHLKTDPEKQKHLAGIFATGYYLASNYHKLTGYWNWLDQQARFLADSVSYGVQEINNLKDIPESVSQWLDEYVERINAVLDQLTLYLGYHAAMLNNRIFNLAGQLLPRHLNTGLLQDIAVNALRATAEVDVTLLGMRHPAYVDDAIEWLSQEHPPLSLNKWRKWHKALKGLSISPS